MTTKTQEQIDKEAADKAAKEAEAKAKAEAKEAAKVAAKAAKKTHVVQSPVDCDGIRYAIGEDFGHADPKIVEGLEAAGAIKRKGRGAESDE